MTKSARPKSGDESGSSEAENVTNVEKKRKPRVKSRGRKALSSSAKSKKMREYQKSLRAKETPAEREARLADMRERARMKIASETSEQREARLSNLRQLASARIRSESYEKKEARLANLRERAKEKRVANEDQ